MKFPKNALPSQRQIRWQATETNVFFHFGINTYTGREWGDGTDDPKLFNPRDLDCRQWAKVSAEAGFKIGILTAKHHDGFCLWPSCFTDYSVISSPWKEGKGDIVREFVEAFTEYGLKVGLYLSPWDRHEASYGDSERYNDYYCHQLTELLSHYGPIDEVWFDGACAEGPNGRRQEYDWERYFNLVRTLQHDAVTFGDGGTDIRWVGNERGYAGETCWSTIDPCAIRFPGDSGISEANDALAHEDLIAILNGGQEPGEGKDRIWRPAECDVSIRPGWFYHPEQDEKIRTVDNLVELYFKSVGRNSLLLLNLPITPDGLIHPLDAARVTEWREVLNGMFEKNLIDENSTFLTERPGQITVTLEEAASARVLCLQERISEGQRIRAYRFESQDVSGEWHLLAQGTTVGHKRLQHFAPFTSDRFRLTIDDAWGDADLSFIGIY